MKTNYTFQKILFLLAFITNLEMQSQCTTPSQMPYQISFNLLTANNQLPPCWSASSLGSTCLTYAAGNASHATFSYSPMGTSYFYTGAVQLSVGITYSTCIWYLTTFFSTSTFTDLSICLGTSQSSVGMIAIASLTGNIASTPTYDLLSNTFTVGSTGVYYFGVRATCTSEINGVNLDWGGFWATIPCSGAGTVNLPPTNVSASATDICQGASVNLSASPITNTYLWSTYSGSISTANSITASPPQTTTYVVTSTNTLTGCAPQYSIPIVVHPASPIFLAASPPGGLCAGSAYILSATGSNTSYTWSTGSNNYTAVVNPSANTIYSVTGQNAYGCASNATIQVQVNPLPNLTVTAIPSSICLNQSSILTVTGAINYTWTSSGSNQTSISFSGQNPGTYTFAAAGTDANGCTNTVSTQVQVNPLPSLTVTTNPSVICINQSSILKATGAANYTWISSGFNQAAPIINYTGQNTGLLIFTVTGSDVNGCVNTETISLTVNYCDGISQIKSRENDSQISPNPANEILNFKFWMLNEDVQIIVCDLVGREVKKVSVSIRAELNIADVPDGIYFVSVFSEGKVLATEKLIVSH